MSDGAGTLAVGRPVAHPAGEPSPRVVRGVGPGKRTLTGDLTPAPGSPGGPDPRPAASADPIAAASPSAAALPRLDLRPSGGRDDVSSASGSTNRASNSAPVPRAPAVGAPPDLGNYDSAVGKHVLVLRTWDTTTIAARRVELQGRLSRTTDVKARDELVREYEAIEWVAHERNLALPKDPDEDAAPQAFLGGKPIKFQVPDNAQAMRAMLEREMAAGTGYAAAKEHAATRIGYATLSRSALNNDKHLIGDQQTELMDHDAAAFRTAFQAEARHAAHAMLDASSIAVDAALRSYGVAGGTARLSDAARKVARQPDSLDVEVDKWVTLSAHADANHAAFAAGHGHRDALAKEAEQLRALQDSIAALASEQLRLIPLAQANRHEHPELPRRANQPDWRQLDGVPAKSQPLQGSVRNPFDAFSKPSSGTSEQQLAFVRSALQARRAQFKLAWIQAERAHPILAAYRGSKPPDASTLPGAGSDEATTRSVIKHVLPKLGNIYRTKAALQGVGGTLDPLQLAPVVELAKQRMFVAEDSYRDRAVHDMVAEANEHHGGPVSWAFDAVLIGLTLITLVPTAGASAGLALALTGLAYDLYAGMGEYEDFQTMSAAADTDLDKIRSLSDTEPSLTPLLMRMVSAGLNLTMAGALFKRAVALHRMALGNAVERDAVVALNKAGDEVGVAGVGDEAVRTGDAGSSTAASSRREGSAPSATQSIVDPHATVELQGLAQTPKTYPWPANAGGRVRSVAEAKALASSHGVVIPDDIKFIAVNGRSLPKDAFAEYLNMRASSIDEMVSWEQFYNRFERIPVKLSTSILGSDEAIVAVIGHEMHELNSLRAIFEKRGGSIPARELRMLISPDRPGNLHDHAWDVADKLVSKMRTGGQP